MIHYLVKKTTDDALDVELVCLAKSGSHPNITWHRADDGAHFYAVSPSSNVDIVESFPNIYRTRSELKFRSMKPTSDVTIACEASDVVGSKGSISKSITVPKGNHVFMQIQLVFLLVNISIAKHSLDQLALIKGI